MSGVERNGRPPMNADVLAAEFMALARLRDHLEPWLDKKEAANHYSCSTRSIDYALKAGMPHAVIFGKVKIRVTEADPWLEQHGDLVRRGDRGYDGSNVSAPAAQHTPRGRTPGGTPGAS